MLNDDVQAFLGEMSGGILCTRDADNRPQVCACFLVDIADDHVIGVVPEGVAAGLAANIDDNGAAALVASRFPGDHRSVQLKGTITQRSEPGVYADELEPTLPAITRYIASVPPEVALTALQDMAQYPAYRFRLDVAEVFDQTPGPRAGHAVEAAPS